MALALNNLKRVDMPLNKETNQFVCHMQPKRCSLTILTWDDKKTKNELLKEVLF